ncbi:SDR family oxidoreductase [Marininema halotolerans]|uniref:Uncharacterized conserved protein YbjT, contains NAD(P)-binding and DUF2867 domains n=1 Tax=Marininema halotolerans TaxID=1155944 RepID=A0A1I6S0X9_9BACL|nr:SDR family oxidoreductase [Marininema halotolerans]SFS70566.1 Uncharacterized conserved protein YbjT, contains NAD(P)-binding and DUF2867 domains [Marininema halotolerans]
MQVLLIGANGKTGRFVVEYLSKHPGHRVRAMVRDKIQAPELEALGAEVVEGDLEKDFGHAYEGIDAVIFAAGSGSKTGSDKTELVDRLGAIRSIDEAIKQDTKRYIMLSSMGADEPQLASDSMRYYLQAKKDADDHLSQSGLNYTIVRPGALSDDPPAGTIEAADRIEDRSRRISRGDVAQVLIQCLDEENTYGKTFEMLSGSVPVPKALQSI